MFRRELIKKKYRHSFMLVRHGESIWNFDDRFTGWTNIPLTETGRNQAYNMGQLLKDKLHKPSVLFSSELERGIETCRLLRNGLDEDVTIKITWRLNEKHYGPCEGLPRDVISKVYGDDFLKDLRSSYTTMPPVIGSCSLNKTMNETPYYRDNNLHLGESNKMVLERLLPYWNKCIVPYMKKQHRIPLIVTHKHCARVLIKHLSNMNEDDFKKYDMKNAVIHHIFLNNDLEIENLNEDILLLK